MNPHASPVPVAEDGPVSCRVIGWTHRGELHLTVAVKATFTLVAGAEARLGAPEPLRLVDVHRNGDPRMPLEAPGEIVPWLNRAEVTLTGTAHVKDAIAATKTSVRLGVRRGRAPLLDKELVVFGDGPAFMAMGFGYDRALATAENPSGLADPRVIDPRSPRALAGFGPIARAWPGRASAVGALDATLRAGARIEVPASFDGRALNSAPADQLVDTLVGDETIRLVGMHPTLYVIESRLPSARAFAHVRRRRLVGEETVPLDLRADMLRIDADRMRCHLVWRARFQPAGEAELRTLSIDAGLFLGDRRQSRDGVSVQATAASPPTLLSTAVVQPAVQQRKAGGSLSGTIPLDEASPGGSATPFPAREGTSPASAPTHTPMPGAPWGAPSSAHVVEAGEGQISTLHELPTHVAAQLRGPVTMEDPNERPATLDAIDVISPPPRALPFEGSSAKAPEPSSLVDQRPATPISGAPWSSEPARRVAPGRGIPSTIDLDPGFVASALGRPDPGLREPTELSPPPPAMPPYRPPGEPLAPALEAGPAGERTLEDYARIRLELDRASNRSEALRALGIEPAEWSQMDRHWRRRALTDGTIAKQLREKLAAVAKRRS